MSIIKSKKASIPVTVLVVLTLALCIFALVSFSLASDKKASDIEGYEILGKAYSAKTALDAGYEVPSSFKEEFDSYSYSGGVLTVTKQERKSGIINAIQFWKDNKFVKYRVYYSSAS